MARATVTDRDEILAAAARGEIISARNSYILPRYSAPALTALYKEGLLGRCWNQVRQCWEYFDPTQYEVTR
jgi:hypothetical protein